MSIKIGQNNDIILDDPLDFIIISEEIRANSVLEYYRNLAEKEKGKYSFQSKLEL